MTVWMVFIIPLILLSVMLGDYQSGQNIPQTCNHPSEYRPNPCISYHLIDRFFYSCVLMQLCVSMLYKLSKLIHESLGDPVGMLFWITVTSKQRELI